MKCGGHLLTGVETRTWSCKTRTLLLTGVAFGRPLAAASLKSRDAVPSISLRVSEDTVKTQTRPQHGGVWEVGGTDNRRAVPFLTEVAGQPQPGGVPASPHTARDSGRC